MSQESTENKPTSPLKILVVDDERVNKQLAVALIEECGHEATEAADGEQAVELVRSNDFHLVFMDVDMPRMDGLEATRQIREHEKDSGKHTPIVALTASANREPCIAAGMDEYLDKPISAVQLVKTIEQFGAGANEQQTTEELLHILLVEDSLVAARLAEMCLNKSMLVPYSLETVTTLQEATQRLAVGRVDLLLLDLNLPDSQGLDTFLDAQKKAGSVPIVILSGESDESQAITAVRRGAQDYLVKGRFDDVSLCRAVHFSIERSRRRAEDQLKQTQSQLYIAQSVQRELFPKSAPDVADIDVFGKCEPADETGGDYYDYIPMGDGIALVTGDASGHGVGAAFVMVATRAILRSLTTIYHDTGYLLSTINQLLADDMRDGSFITLLLTYYDPKTRLLTYSGAGHAGYLLDANGELKHCLKPSGPPLNVVRDAVFETSPPIQVESGDILLQYTDGASERIAPSGGQFGGERMLKQVQAHRDLDASGLVEMLFHAVHDFARWEKQEDDITIVVTKFQ